MSRPNYYFVATGTPWDPHGMQQNNCRNPNTIPGMPVETT